MKTFVAALLVFSAISASQAALDRNESIKLLEKCKKETNAKEDPAHIYDSEELPKSKEGKCMMACVLREKGLMKDGKMIGSAVSEFMEKTYSENPEMLEKVAGTIGKCSATVDTKGLDACDLAYAYMDCGKKDGIKLT